MSEVLRRASARIGTGTRIAQLLLAALLLPAGALIWHATGRLTALLFFPYSRDGLEGTLLYEARLLRSGEPLYQPLELYRFVSAPYPPVHYLFLALADLIPGPHIFWGGRLLSLAAALAVTTLVILIIRHASSSWLAALVGAALFLSAPPVILWATRIKPDLLALLFTTSGLYLASRAINQHTTDQKKLIGAALLFVLAFFTKQTTVAGPLATGLALLLSDVRAWRANVPDARIGRIPLRWPTLIFTLVYFIAALGVWFSLDIMTSDQYTVHVWWSGQRVEWWTFPLLGKFASLLAYLWPLMVLGLITLVLAFREQRGLIPACYLLAAPLTLLGAGETGANHNHLIETILALILAGATAAGWAAQEAKRVWPVVLPLLLAFQVAMVFSPPDWYTGELYPSDTPERFLVFMRNTPGEILADDIGLLFQAGKPLRYNDPSTIGPAVRIGKWDQRGLLEDIANRRFSAIMLPLNAEKETIDATGRWTPEMLAAIRAHYRLLYRDKIYTFVPR